MVEQSVKNIWSILGSKSVDTIYSHKQSVIERLAVIQSAMCVYSDPAHLCLSRTIFIVIIEPAGPFILDIFGPARLSMHPGQIFLYMIIHLRTNLLNLSSAQY